MASENKGYQWGPVYLDEFQSVEVRSLSNGARELWIAISARTRSAKQGPESETGYFASYEALAKDLSRWSKTEGKLKPISVRTVKRYASELKEAGLLDVQRTPGPACLVILRPLSLRSPKSVPSTRDKRAALVESVTERGQDSGKRGQKRGVEVTSMGVTYSNPNRSHRSSSDQGTSGKMGDEMAAWMVTQAALGKSGRKEDRFDLRESFAKLGCKSWYEAALVAPQSVRGSFAQWRPEGFSDAAFDQLIRAAGQCAKDRCLCLFSESSVVRNYRIEHPELEIPPGASDEEADKIFEAELTRKTGF